MNFYHRCTCLAQIGIYNHPKHTLKHVFNAWDVFCLGLLQETSCGFDSNQLLRNIQIIYKCWNGCFVIRVISATLSSRKINCLNFASKEGFIQCSDSLEDATDIIVFFNLVRIISLGSIEGRIGT
jgi:hypothetical protein